MDSLTAVSSLVLVVLWFLYSPSWRLTVAASVHLNTNGWTLTQAYHPLQGGCLRMSIVLSHQWWDEICVVTTRHQDHALFSFSLFWCHHCFFHHRQVLLEAQYTQVSGLHWNTLRNSFSPLHITLTDVMLEFSYMCSWFNKNVHILKKNVHMSHLH